MDIHQLVLHCLPLAFYFRWVTGLKELAFLRDLAEQNSGKYGVLDRIALPVIKGSMMVLNQLSNLETTVGRFYTNLPNRMIDEAVFSLPSLMRWEMVSSGKLPTEGKQKVDMSQTVTFKCCSVFAM